MRKVTLFIFVEICIISCKPANQLPRNTKEAFREPVEIGMPITKEIDEKGGVIDIDVNESKVIFNPNSVLKSTIVSIQPISNPLSNFGLGLRASSDYKNIKIELKYPLNGMPANNFEIFYAQGIEWIKIKNKTIDTVNHTISIVHEPGSAIKLGTNARGATHVYDYVIGK